MRKRICTIALILATVVLLAGMLASSASANGKSWSSQVFYDDSNIVIIGNENKFATVYAIDLVKSEIIWKAPLPQSQRFSILRDGDTVYLIGSRDMGIFDKTLIAHSLKENKVIWSRKIKDYTRVSPLFEENDRIFFVAGFPFRGCREIRMMAFDKSDGSTVWEHSAGVGNLKDIQKLPSGDFVLTIDAEPTFLGRGSGKETPERSIRLVRISAADGKPQWDVTYTDEAECETKGIVGKPGVVSSTPRLMGNAIYFLGTSNGSSLQDEKKTTLYAVNTETGNIDIDVVLPEGIKLYGEPFFIGNRIGMLTTDGKVYTYYIENGEEITAGQASWSFEIGDLPIAQAVLSPESDRMFLSSNKLVNDEVLGSTITALSTTDGTVLWKYETNDLLEPPLLICNDSLYIYEKVKVVQTPEEIKEGKEKVNICKYEALNIETGEKMWSIQEMGQRESDTVAHEDTLYLFIQQKIADESGKKSKDDKVSHILTAVDRKTGTKKWEYKTEAAITSPLFFLEGTVRFGTQDGNLLSLSMDKGEVVSDFFTGTQNELDSSIAVVRDSSGSITHMGFATHNGKYFITDASGKKIKDWTLKPLFALFKLPILVGAILLGGAISWYIYHAKRGKEMFIRRIAGLNAIDEAVGRSTEMGKPVVYVTGLADVDDIQTLASLSIMGHIAQKTAEYDTPIIVPCCRSVVMSTAQEVVKESYLKAGRPDTYRRENIYYLTDDQFGYVAGVDGIMVREKPAANFYLGKFYAESLILAETGHSTGAIQIAGTAEASQLPFFVAACDYTLIGEELFAASAYLSKDPMQIGSLKGQDIAKAIILVAILTGCALLSFNLDWVKMLFATQ